MARGWESKAVEAQIEESNVNSTGETFSAEERRALLKKKDLQLSRRRIQQQLERSPNERYRSCYAARWRISTPRSQRLTSFRRLKTFEGQGAGPGPHPEGALLCAASWNQISPSKRLRPITADHHTR